MRYSLNFFAGSESLSLSAFSWLVIARVVVVGDLDKWLEALELVLDMGTSAFVIAFGSDDSDVVFWL